MVGRPVPDASNAVVWIEGAHGGGAAPAEGQMKSEQKRFTPRVVIVRPNATVQAQSVQLEANTLFETLIDVRHPDDGLYRKYRYVVAGDVGRLRNGRQHQQQRGAKQRL